MNCQSIVVMNNFEKLIECEKPAEVIVKVDQNPGRAYCVGCAKEIIEYTKEQGMKVLAASL